MIRFTNTPPAPHAVWAAPGTSLLTALGRVPRRPLLTALGRLPRTLLLAALALERALIAAPRIFGSRRRRLVARRLRVARFGTLLVLRARLRIEVTAQRR